MKSVIPLALFTFDRLELKAPPADIFEDLLGYSGKQRFIGFSYTGRALCIEDGRSHEIGHRAPWATWYRSLGVKVLRHYCFGYEGRAPEHLLILDRKSRALYAAPVLAVQDALRQQIPCQAWTAEEALSEVHGEVELEDPTHMLFNTTSAMDREDNQVRLKDGIKRLENWLRII